MNGIDSVRRKLSMGTLLLGLATWVLVGTSCTSSRTSHEYVDLGLPSMVLLDLWIIMSVPNGLTNPFPHPVMA